MCKCTHLIIKPQVATVLKKILMLQKTPEVAMVFNTRCRPSKGRRCTPDVVLKNEGPMVQIRRNINVHVVNTDIC